MIEPFEVALQVSVRGADDAFVDRLTCQLLQEIRQLDIESAEMSGNGLAQAGTKGIDPMILGMLVVTVGPTVLTKFLEFLHDWAMRREDRIVKIKVQNPDGGSVEIEVPQTTKPDELRDWIQTVEHTLEKHEARKNPKRK